MARTGQPAVRHVAAVERAFAVLDALSDGGELGTNEIARRTGINASTVSRLLATLASARFVEHVPESGRYRLSLRLIELGNAVLGRLDLRALARPHLQALVRETGETATLSAPGEHDAITVDFAHSSSVVQSVAQLGRPSVGHATAAGKVMLAFGDVELPAEPLHGVHAAHDHDPRPRSSPSSSASASAASPTRGRSERRDSRRSPRLCGTAVVRSPGSSACRGRRRASTQWQPSPPPPGCSSTLSPSPPSSAGRARQAARRGRPPAR